MQLWITDSAADGIDDKIKMAYILLIRLRRTIVPPFHYSIFAAYSIVQSIYILSAGYLNFDIFEQTWA